mgnify:CR=1 FL=1
MHPLSIGRPARRSKKGILLLAAALVVMPATLLAQSTASPQPLGVSEDGRRIVYEDGTPFFWLGDTAWELFHRLDREEADAYLRDRAEKGFTVIQAVVLAELDGLEAPNPYGHVPLEENDPSRPNEAYFEHVDYVVDRAAALGLYVGMLPTWGDKFNKKWGVGPEVFTPENARAYGEFLGARYKDAPVVWILGGDRNPEDEEDLAIVRAMAEGIRAGDGGRHLMTYHPQGGSASWQWFHEDEWLDVHMFQSGHGAFDTPNYERTVEGYLLRPVRPVLDGEPRYEDHPVNWNPDFGWLDAFDVRQAAYWSMLSGAFGHTYGDHNIWQMWEPGREPISSARTPWRQALDHAGATHMGYMRRLFESRPFLDLVPDQSVLAGEAGTGAAHIRAARDREGRYLFAYTPYGKPVRVWLGRLQGGEARAYWFDPRTGEAEAIGTYPAQGARTFDPPGGEGRGRDWVLVVDDAAQNFGIPGAGE